MLCVHMYTLRTTNLMDNFIYFYLNFFDFLDKTFRNLFFFLTQKYQNYHYPVRRQRCFDVHMTSF